MELPLIRQKASHVLYEEDLVSTIKGSEEIPQSVMEKLEAGEDCWS